MHYTGASSSSAYPKAPREEMHYTGASSSSAYPKATQPEFIPDMLLYYKVDGRKVVCYVIKVGVNKKVYIKVPAFNKKIWVSPDELEEFEDIKFSRQGDEIDDSVSAAVLYNEHALEEQADLIGSRERPMLRPMELSMLKQEIKRLRGALEHITPTQKDTLLRQLHFYEDMLQDKMDNPPKKQSAKASKDNENAMFAKGPYEVRASHAEPTDPS
jgi:hypothetical protein